MLRRPVNGHTMILCICLKGQYLISLIELFDKTNKQQYTEKMGSHINYARMFNFICGGTYIYVYSLMS